MAINNAYEKYKKVDVSTASQSRLVVMMYEGAVKFLENACRAIDKKHGTEEVHNNILKAQEIIYELLASLNYDAGEIANRLASIYTYMNQRLTEGNIAKTKEPVYEVIKYLKELKLAWESAETNVSKNTSLVSKKVIKSDEKEEHLKETQKVKNMIKPGKSSTENGKLNITG